MLLNFFHLSQNIGNEEIYANYNEYQSHLNSKIKYLKQIDLSKTISEENYRLELKKCRNKLKEFLLDFNLPTERKSKGRMVKSLVITGF